jgi:hypothetical protein
MITTLDQTQTYQDSLVFFQQYADESLSKHNPEVKEALKRRQIATNQILPLEETYKINLKLGENLSFKQIETTLLKQIDAAADFIRDFQIGILGQRSSIFQIYELEIQIEDNLKYGISFEGGKLSIQIPSGQITFFSRYLNTEEIKKSWHRGLHLAKFSPARRVWWLLNPIGEFRSNLRTILLLAIQKHILGIDKLFAKFGLVDLDDNPNIVVSENQTFKDKAITFLKQTVNEDKLGMNLEQILKNQDETTLVKLLGLFKNKLADPGQIEELIDVGSLSLQEVIQEEQSQVNINMFGLVNVGNYHRIDVALNLSKGYLNKYVELVPRKADVKAILLGFVNVYTIDDITVKPNFHSAIKFHFETAALERALKELQLLE